MWHDLNPERLYSDCRIYMDMCFTEIHRKCRYIIRKIVVPYRYVPFSSVFSVLYGYNLENWGELEIYKIK